MSRRPAYAPVIVAGLVATGPVKDLCPRFFGDAYDALSPAYVNLSPELIQPGWTWVASGQVSSLAPSGAAFDGSTFAPER